MSRGEIQNQLQANSLVSKILLILGLTLVIFGEYMGDSYSKLIVSLFSFLMLLMLLIKSNVKFPKKLTYLTLLFLIWLLVSTINSKVIELSLVEFIYYVSLMSIFFVGFNTFKNSLFTIKGTTIVGSFLIYGYFLFEFPSRNFLQGVQFTGPFFWHNQMAAFILFILPLSIAYFISSSKHKYLWMLNSVLLFIPLLFTYSRGAWLSIGISITAGAVIFFRKEITFRRFAFVGLLTFLFLISVFILPQTQSIENRLISIISETSSRSVSSNVRINASNVAIEIANDYKITGAGPGTVGELYYKYQQEPWIYARHTHNHYLQLFAEIGYIGGVIFISLIFGILFYSAKWGSSLSGENRYLLSGIFTALLASAIHNLLDVDWNKTSLAFLFFLYAGFALSLSIKSKQILVIRKDIEILVKLTLVLLVFVSFYLFVFINKLETGKDFIDDQEFEKSFGSYQKAANLLPISHTPYLYLGRLDKSRGNTTDALEYFQFSTSNNPYNAEPLYQSGLIHQSNGNIDDAINSVKSAIHLNPFAEPEYYITLSSLYSEKGEKELVLEILREAVENRFPVNDSYLGFWYLYEETGMNLTLMKLYVEYVKQLIQNGDQIKANEIMELATKTFLST